MFLGKGVKEEEVLILGELKDGIIIQELEKISRKLILV